MLYKDPFGFSVENGQGGRARGQDTTYEAIAVAS